jgi:hypothetical protein
MTKINKSYNDLTNSIEVINLIFCNILLFIKNFDCFFIKFSLSEVLTNFSQAVQSDVSNYLPLTNLNTIILSLMF